MAVADVAAALAWPILVGVILIVYRKSIPKLIAELAPRISGFSFGLLSFQFREARGFEPTFPAGLYDARSGALSGFTSAAPELLKQVEKDAPVDYAVFDLGKGGEWITSRLYFIVATLQKKRALRCVVFLDSFGEQDRHFAGSLEPNEVLWTLTRRYPWLEVSFAKAEDDATMNTWPGTTFLQSLLQIYLNGLQKPSNSPVDSTWVLLPQSQTNEHSAWLDSGTFRDLFGDIANRFAIHKEEFLQMTSGEQAKLILIQRGTFVAVVDQSEQFDKLIDRHDLLERIARDLVLKSR